MDVYIILYMTQSSQFSFMSQRLWGPTLEGNYPPKLEVIFCVRGVISPLLSNIYLNGLDWKMTRNGFEMVRYADDFVVLCASQEEAQKALEQISQWVEENGLKLHPTKTRLVDASQRGGVDFLGYHFERGKKWPRKKSNTYVLEKTKNPASLMGICVLYRRDPYPIRIALRASTEERQDGLGA